MPEEGEEQKGASRPPKRAWEDPNPATKRPANAGTAPCDQRLVKLQEMVKENGDDEVRSYAKCAEAGKSTESMNALMGTASIDDTIALLKSMLIMVHPDHVMDREWLDPDHSKKLLELIREMLQCARTLRAKTHRPT